MKLLTALFVILFCIHFDGAKGTPLTTFNLSPSQKKTEDGNEAAAQPNTTERITTPASASEQNSLENISIQDLLLSGIDGNEKIQKRIISEIKDFPTNFKNYAKPTTLTTAGYSFRKKLIKYEMDKGYIVYRNVSVSHFNDYNDDQFSVSVHCDSSSTAKISVGLPKKIKILANFSITHPLVENTNEGAIQIILKNGVISKQVTYTNCTGSNLENISSTLSYTDSNIDVEFNGPHSLIYNKVEAFLDEIESSLREFFTQQLDELTNERQLNFASDCSKIRFTEPNLKKIHLPYFNNFLNNLYVIPEAKVESWKGIALSAGPIVIDGFSFNSTELSISKQYHTHYGHRPQFSSRIKTGNLKGKFQWNYNLANENGENSSSVFYFTIDNIIFENNIARNSYFTNDMNVYIGKTKIKPPASNLDKNELKFAEFVLSEYLKSAIAESLKNALSVKSDDTQRQFASRLFDNM